MNAYRKQLSESDSSPTTRIGKDGKNRPATQPRRAPVEVDDYDPEEDSEVEEPCVDSPAAKPKLAEPNKIGEAIFRLRTAGDEEIDGLGVYQVEAILSGVELWIDETRKELGLRKVS